MAIDSKYGDVDVAGIPDDEPIFIFRAQDILAPLVLDFYASMRESQGDREGAHRVTLASSRFRVWPERKLPD